jgi:hypothetical protein
MENPDVIIVQEETAACVFFPLKNFHYLRTEGGGQWYKWFWTLQDLAYVDLCVFIN